MTQHPPVHTIQKIPFWDFMDGRKLSPRGQFIWSVYIYFFWAFFSQLVFFPPSPVFLLLGTVFLSLFFSPSPLIQVFFGELPPTPQLTSHRSSYQPTYLPHPADCSPPTSFGSHLHH